MFRIGMLDLGGFVCGVGFSRSYYGRIYFESLKNGLSNSAIFFPNFLHATKIDVLGNFQNESMSILKKVHLVTYTNCFILL